MKQEIEYINDKMILVRKVRGKLDFSELYDFWVDLIENKKIDPGIKGIINDLRGSELNMTIPDVKKLIMLFEANSDIFLGKRMAVVTDSSQNIVFPMIGQKITSKIEVRPFSTFQAATDWILNLIE
jgi:hypothetical protein